MSGLTRSERLATLSPAAQKLAATRGIHINTGGKNVCSNVALSYPWCRYCCVLIKGVVVRGGTGSVHDKAFN